MPADDVDFEAADLVARLAEMDPAELDELPFGVVAIDEGGHVLAYNRWEAALSGLDTERVIGQHFFTQVAPCTNNFMVAERFHEPAVDAMVDYVFTFRMQPTEVRLRILVEGDDRFLCVERV